LMGFYSQVIFPRLCDLLLNRPFVAKHRKQLLSTAYGDVLEVGFGTGLNLPYYPAQVKRITTVDPNTGMHRLAQRRIRQLKIEVDHRVLSGERLPFEGGTFDCAISTFTLCSIGDVGQALSEVYRVLKPGGRLLFLEHGLIHKPDRLVWLRSSTVTLFTHPAGRDGVGTLPWRRTNGRCAPPRCDEARG
jgi:ubiquinone/menaquinone biosynthesis C-methylase UbiE